MAQNRLTAVGRVAAIRSHSFWNSVANCFVPVALLRRIPSATPIAAATPIAGAPRMTIVLIAFATSWAVLQETYTSDAGSFRWSIMTTASSFHSIVGSIVLMISGGIDEKGEDAETINRKARKGAENAKKLTPRSLLLGDLCD